ncbi:MAG: DUF1460 domain-containing protein [Muribaculaceae bacterium]|nr:DUF1460 domain-containing protein [Muribaculaceae bacterium]
MKIFIKKIILLISILLLSQGFANAVVRYHCEADSVAAIQLLEKISGIPDIGTRVMEAALALQNVPAGEAADNDLSGTLVVRLDTLSMRELLNVSLAAAIAAAKTNPGLRDFEKALESVSRKKGQDNGFTSQFFYASDWIVDNVYRGNVKEMTEYLENGNYKTKTLDFMTRHRDEFPALQDSATYENVKVIEMGFRSHRVPHLKKHYVGNKPFRDMLQDGDIIIMLPPETDFDIFDMGIIHIKNNEPYLIHISKDHGKVVEDPYPLARRFKLDNQFFYGFRWLKPTE